MKNNEIFLDCQNESCSKEQRRLCRAEARRKRLPPCLNTSRLPEANRTDDLWPGNGSTPNIAGTA